MMGLLQLLLPYHFITKYLLPFSKYVGRRRQQRIPFIEWILAWTIIVLFGIRYVVDYMYLRWNIMRLQRRPNDWWAQQIPLCSLAHTRKELGISLQDRWENLIKTIRKELQKEEVGQQRHDQHQQQQTTSNLNELSDDEWVNLVHSSLDVRREMSYLMYGLPNASNETLNGLYQSQTRMSTRTATTVDEHDHDNGYEKDGRRPPHDNQLVSLLSKFQRLWPRFLQFPERVITRDGLSSSLTSDSVVPGGETVDDGAIPKLSSSLTLSLIIPMYRERIEDVRKTLHHALTQCRGNPKHIQVIVVHVQDDDDDMDDNDNGDVNDITSRQKISSLNLERQLRYGQQHEHPQKEQQHETTSSSSSSSSSTPSWGALHVVTLRNQNTADGGGGGGEGGRGRTLNVGFDYVLNHSQRTPIVTFLHADTLVPMGWDIQIVNTLLPSYSATTSTITSNGTDAHRPSHPTQQQQQLPVACAFTMGIDGIDNNKNQGSNPPGLVGAQWLGVLRCHLCRLPYGDSVLSFDTSILEYIGGFPQQPFMEDYELVDWLRTRSYLLSGTTSSSSSGVVLLKDPIRCSPRRWKAYGVAYTTLVNAICIYRYRTLGVSADELFDFYYHSSVTGTTTTTTTSTNARNDDTGAQQQQHKNKSTNRGIVLLPFSSTRTRNNDPHISCIRDKVT